MSISHQQHVLFSIKKNIGFIKLNRPEALNALNPGMMASIRQRLIHWSENQDVHGVVVHSNSERAFCAGGDLKAVYNAGTKKQFEYLDNLFREEYLLNHLIHTYPKPYISFIDGIVMGGGAGLSVHGSHRLMSEKTLAAMPETNIGYFPDVGASYFLNQAPGNLGLYLGLTGNHIQLGDALYAKMGTHYIPQEKQADLLQELKTLKHKTPETIEALVNTFKEPAPDSSLQEKQEEIDTLFTGTTLKDILKNLDQASSEFAKETLETLKKRSPTSLAITFEQLKRAKDMTDFAEIMSMEFNLSQNFVQKHDFFEGIRSVVIDKDHAPKWSPDSLDKISAADVDAYFQQLPRPLMV